MKDISKNKINYRNLPVFKSLTTAMMITTLAVAPILLEQTTPFDFGSSVFAAHTGNGQNGKGDGGAGDGNGNKGGGSKGGGGKSPKGELYGDQYYLDRNDDGIPYVDDNNCLRPIVSDTGELIPLLGDAEGSSGINEGDLADCAAPLAPAVSESLHSPELAAAVEVEESDACDVQAECLDLLEEAELGRLSAIRAPERVLDRQRNEAADLINGASVVVLDHSGRPVVDSLTLDSPIINLSLFRDFLLYGALHHYDNQGNIDIANVWVPGVGDADLPQDSTDIYEPILAAAFGLAAGDDKFANPIDVEIVARSAKILFLADNTTYLSTLPGPVYYGGGGASDENFIDLSGFTYSRADTFPGSVCVGVTTGLSTTYYEYVIETQILENLNGPGNSSNIAGFAQAAEDARTMIGFYHTPSEFYDSDEGKFPEFAGADNVFVLWASSIFNNATPYPCPVP